MKKIIFVVVIIFIILVKDANAETIYGEYYRVDNLEGQNVDEIKIDSYKLYNTYRIEYEDLGYIEENDSYMKDENDFIYKEIIGNNYNENDEYIIVNLSNINKEKLSFKMGNIGQGLKIYELEIYHKGEKVDYIIGNQSEFDIYNLNIDNISDNNLETYFSHNVSHLYIFIKFLEKYNIEDVEIVIHTKESNDNSFLFYYDNRPKVILHNNIDRKHTISFNLTEENIGLVEYFYKQNIKLYKYYKKKYVKEDIYVKDGENLILDDYMFINEYYKRDKLILKDNLIIDSRDKNIDDLIEYSSNDVITLCDINYNVNGIYKCNFILNDINIEKDILVDIKENEVVENIIEDNNIFEDEKDDIKELENVNKEEINNNEDIVIEDVIVLENNTIEESNEVVDNKEIEIFVETEINKANEKNVSNHNNISNNEKTNEIICTKEIKKNSLKNVVSNKEKGNYESENLLLANKRYNQIQNKYSENNLKIFVIIILIVLILVKIFILIKRKRNNVESI